MHELSDVLRSIWAKQANGKKPYFCISTKRVGDDQWKDHLFKWPNLTELEDILSLHPTKKFNLYFCPLPFSRPHRRREYVMGSNMLWADIDNTNPKKMAIPPHILWESSPGRWAGLWLTERWLEVGELEDYNKRMTYGTESDKAGWDITQVLRIPGTLNHKYKGSPVGRLTHMDFKSKIRLSEIPQLGSVSQVGSRKAVEIFEKWRPKLRGETRSALTASKATVGKRSEVLWKLYHQLFDAGVPLDDIRLLVKESVWNKYRGRRDEDRQLDRDIEKCLKVKMDEKAEGTTNEKGALAGAGDHYEGVSADKVKCAEVDWLWWPYISRGALTIVEGDPGLGKSYFMQMVCGAICDGGKLPGEGGLNGKQRIKSGRVYYFSVEDDPGTVIVPRLRWNKIRALSSFRIFDRKLTMDEEGLTTAEFLVEKYKVDMVVFDTLNYFVGGIDVHRANEVSQQMEHFQRLAHKNNVAVVVLRHLTKNSTGVVKAAYRGQGSIAFSGAAREVLTVGTHPDDIDLRIIAVTKLNLEALPKALGFRIKREGRESRFEWSDDLYDLTSQDIIDVKLSSKDKKKDELGEAVKFLSDKLGDGAMESDQLDGLAEAAGMSKSALRRGKKELGVRIVKRGGKWFCSLK